MLQPVYIVAFTGHRSSSAAGRTTAELEACRPLIAQALAQLQDQVAEKNGVIHLISSAAEGADAIALETAQSMGITTHILLPLPESAFEEDFADRMPAWAITEKLIRSAENPATTSTVRIAEGTHERPDCYADTNAQMLSSADALIALWNEEPAQGTGGTAQVWNAAAESKMARIHINPATHTIAATELDSLASSDDIGQTLFDTLQPHLPSPADQPAGKKAAHSETCHIALDELANTASKSARFGNLSSITLHGLASFVAAVGVSWALADTSQAGKMTSFTETLLISASILEFFLILGAELIHRHHHHHHTADKWIRYRFAAELLRPFHLIYQHLDPFRPLIQHHHPEWRRLMLSVGLASPIQSKEHLAQAKENYIQDRIDDQISYFSGKLKTASPTATRIYRTMRIASISALVIVLIAVIYKLTHFQIPSIPTAALKTPLYLLPIALPLLAGILLALRQSLDIARRNVRYRHMESYLVEMKAKITHAHTRHTFCTLVAKTEATLLDELKEFDIAQRIGMEH